MLLRLAYLGVTNALALLRLLPMSDRDKDAEILALRHQITVLERQLHGDRVRFTSVDRAWLAALLHPLPANRTEPPAAALVRPETVLRWHRDLTTRRHARHSRPLRPGRPPTIRSIRALVLRLARENTGWGYRRIHGELLVLGVKVAASTVWEILKDAGVDPAPDRTHSTWATFLRSQAQAIIAADFFETVTLTGARYHQLGILAQDRGDFVEAERRYQQSLTIKEELGNRAGTATTISQLGNLRAETSDPADAVALHCQALAIRLGLGISQATNNIVRLRELRSSLDESAFSEAASTVLDGQSLRNLTTLLDQAEESARACLSACR